MTNRSKLAVFAAIFLFCLLWVAPSSCAETHFNLGLELSGHLIPYFGISIQNGIQEVGANLGLAFPHNLSNFTITDLGYQGTLYYRYDFINTDFYPRLQVKVLTAPPSSGENKFLLLLGGGFQYLFSPKNYRFGGGVEINLGLPISALDQFSFPIPYLSLESSYEFG